MVVHTTRHVTFWFVDNTHRQTDRQTDTLKTIPAFAIAAGNKNLAVANRSRVSCAHNTSDTSRASMITP